MAEQLLPEFEHQALENDMKRLVEEVGKHRQDPETQHLREEALLKKSIQSFTSASNGPITTPTNLQNPLPQYIEDATPEVKLEVEYLLDIAFHQGILKADREARKTSPFVLDAFHDALVKKLYPKIKEQGLLS
ncbi:MAG: hypothetical protein AAB903_02460 [Patescibacteria group bacterium]|mgnify:FL=1